MPTRLRKVRHLRGSRTHGWGRSGQHRAGGMQGGHGRAGWKRHKWSAVIRYGLSMGERGFHPPGRKTVRTINVGQLSLQVDELIQHGHARVNDGTIEVDLGHAGYDKLLGDGPLKTPKPLRVTVSKSSSRAVEKVEEAGGQVILPVKQEDRPATDTPTLKKRE